MSSTHGSITQIDSGVEGIDELLRGGFVEERMYLITGEPGTGKTTVGLHFLEEGLESGETVLYIHGEESSDEIVQNAGQFDIDIADAAFLDLGPDSDFFTEDPSYDLVNPQDVEQNRYTESIHESIKHIDPARVVLDPITQLRYIESSEYHYRKRLLSFMRFLKERGITVVVTATTENTQISASQVRSLSDGVIRLKRRSDGRRIEVEKHRGIGQIDGTHGLEIRTSGLEVFPRVIPEPNDIEFDPTPLQSGLDSLDELVGGGFERGTVTFISGPPGVGKTTTGASYLLQAAKNERHAVMYLFEEREETFSHRCRELGMPIDELRDDGWLSVNTVDPLSLSSEEFAHEVRDEVKHHDAEIVMIDGFGGYTTAIQGETDQLKGELHALTRYLVHNEVTVFVTDSIHQITGISSATSSQISPIADNLLFLSFVESRGSLRKVVGVLKKRAGSFEQSLREFEITENGIGVGEPMTQFSGILHGFPRSDEPNPPGINRKS